MQSNSNRERSENKFCDQKGRRKPAGWKLAIHSDGCVRWQRKFIRASGTTAAEAGMVFC